MHFKQLQNKKIQIRDHFFTLLFLKNSKSHKILDIRLWKVGAKRRSNSTSKVNRHRHRHRHTLIWTFRLKESFENHLTFERLIGGSSHHLDMERLIGRSAYLILKGQICLLC